METKTENGLDYQNNDHEVHVTHAEVNHESQENHESHENHESYESYEPVAPKRNLAPESRTIEEVEEQETESNTIEDTKNEPEVSNSIVETETTPQTEADDSVADGGQTSDAFMKFEEKHVIERLSRVIDTELTLEVLKVDNAENNQEEEVTEEVETKPPEPSTFSAVDVESEALECDLKSDNSIPETQDNHIENEVRLHSYGQRIEEPEPRVVSEQLIEPYVVKHNGTKVDENQNDEEEDELRDIVGFRSTLKMWSSGKTSNPNDQQMDTRDKFKTLRQIKKGNTRSLMERFQQPN